MSDLHGMQWAVVQVPLAPLNFYLIAIDQPDSNKTVVKYICKIAEQLIGKLAFRFKLKEFFFQ